jgi:hypothetical protein
LWADDPNSVGRLATLKAHGFVLGTMVFNPGGSIATYPEQDEEMELKNLLLNFFARMSVKLRALDEETDKVISLSGAENFYPENVETTLDRYSEWSDRNPVDIHDHATYGNRTREQF